MPRGPHGESRPADVIGNAVLIAKIATGEAVDKVHAKSGRVRSGKAGAEARVRATSSEERRAIAKKAAAARWK